MTHKNLKQLTDELTAEEILIRKGGGESGHQRQKKHGRLAVRERLKILLDNPETFLELGLWAGHGMYSEWGGLPAAGLVTGIGRVSGKRCMVIANDATVKAGAMFPQSIKKFLRAQRIAYTCRLPILYLVDSSGVFLPLQDEIFPDEDDFGRIFRNNSIISAAGISQFAAIMGNCIAGGGYLPVLCDQLIMTEGSGLYIAGPALVKAAIGQEVETEALGGVKMHAEVSGTVDYREPDDPACLKRLRELVDLLPKDSYQELKTSPEGASEAVFDIVSANNQKPYDMHQVLNSVIDKGSLEEYKKDYGKTLITAFAKIGGQAVGIVANQRLQVQSGKGETEIGGVIYPESADKAARFVMDCNQMRIPLIFFQDVVGFMVGKNAEESGIIRCGAKLVNALSNSIVPKITVIIGSSFGAGNYALCGKAYDPVFVFAWPNAQYAVMGADQAADTLFEVQKKSAERKGHPWSPEEAEEHRKKIVESYQHQMNIRYGAARGWVDAIIRPQKTREILLEALQNLPHPEEIKAQFHTGVLQV